MKKITRKKHLEMRLQSVPAHPRPKVGLEQYTTPSIIASDLIWNAYSLGDVDEDSIRLAIDVRDKLNVDNLDFIVSDICRFNGSFDADTVFQNPPFGSQRNADSGQDLKFVKSAVELNPEVLYSFHMASTEEFLIKFYSDNNLEITHIFRYKFPIPKIYEFHTKEKADVDVIVMRAKLK